MTLEEMREARAEVAELEAERGKFVHEALQATVERDAAIADRDEARRDLRRARAMLVQAVDWIRDNPAHNVSTFGGGETARVANEERARLLDEIEAELAKRGGT